jgi:ribonuclease HII
MNTKSSTNDDLILGIDESGTGSWAGSFFIVGVLARASDLAKVPGIRDSKKTSRQQRHDTVLAMEREGILHFDAEATPYRIQQYGQSEVYALRFSSVVQDALPYLQGARVVVDGSPSHRLQKILQSAGLSYSFLPKADVTVPQVSAASIFAKFFRDVEMEELDIIFPQYKFLENAGYGTPAHIQAIRQYGVRPCVHRHFVTGEEHG